MSEIVRISPVVFALMCATKAESLSSIDVTAEASAASASSNVGVAPNFE